MNLRRLWRVILLLGFTLIILTFWGRYILCFLNYWPIFTELPVGKKVEVPLKISGQDKNNNNVADALDIVKGARQEVEEGTVYDSSYYAQGYPPPGRGACTDVIWRALKAAGYDLRQMVDEDIRQAPAEYGATGKSPDSAIDFRRVRNLQVFFSRHAQLLTTEVKPGDVDNLAEWQPGDIVVFGPPTEHIGIISDRRRRDGVPLVIHNAGPKASEGDILENWPTKIIYHFRFIRD